MPDRWQGWYPHDIESWNSSADVQALSDAGYRAFHNLLMAQFESKDGMLPNDPRQLAKLSRMFVRWQEPREGYPPIAEEVLEQFEPGPDGRIYNARMYKEWLRARDLFEKRSNGGKRKSVGTVLEDSSKSDARVLEDSTTPIPVPIPVPKAKTKPRVTAQSAFELPDWIPVSAWDAFVEMRNKGRWPLTAAACEQTVLDLDKLRKAGHDPGAVLMQSVQRCWRGVFEIKGQTKAGHNEGHYERLRRELGIEDETASLETG